MELFKQTELYDKIRSAERMGLTVIAFLTISSSICLYIQYKTYTKCIELEKNNTYLRQVCNTQLEKLNTQQYNIQSIDNNMTILNNKTTLMHNTMIILNDKMTTLEKMYLNIPFSPIKQSDSGSGLSILTVPDKESESEKKNEPKINEENGNKTKEDIYEILDNNEDDDLLNECYDMVPLSNLKKSTGLSWLFK